MMGDCRAALFSADDGRLDMMTPMRGSRAKISPGALIGQQDMLYAKMARMSLRRYYSRWCTMPRWAGRHDFHRHARLFRVAF